MGKIDIAIYLILALFLILGFMKGFMKQILSVANWLISLIGAFTLTKPFTNLLVSTPLATDINTKILDWISKQGEIFTVPFNASDSSTQLSAAIQALGLPSFIANIVAGGVKIEAGAGEVTLAQVLAPSIGRVIITIIAFILLFILLLIIMKLIIKLLNVVFNTGILGVINKILGGVLGLIKGLVLICLLMLLVSVLSSVIPSINEFVVGDLPQEGFSIARMFYDTNPLLKLIQGNFSFENILESAGLPL